MAILSPHDLETVRRQQVKNILSKQAAGHALTAREERILMEAASDTPPGASNFARTYDELASRLDVSRKSIQNWQKQYPQDWPRPRGDGRHEVTAWLDFMAMHHLAGADPDGHADDQPVTLADWKAHELKLKCERLEIENTKTAGELVELADVETGTTALVGGFNQALNNFVPRLAQKILGCTDYHEAVEIIQAEVDIVRRTLARCDFLKRHKAASNASDMPLPSQEPPREAPPAKKASKTATVGKKPPGAKKVPTKTLPPQTGRRTKS